MLSRIETSAEKNTTTERLSIRDAAIAFVLDVQRHPQVEIGTDRIKLNHGPQTVVYLGSTSTITRFRRRVHHQ
jgi:hypothetical protein